MAGDVLDRHSLDLALQGCSAAYELDGQHSELIQAAYFQPVPFWDRAYWDALFPVHYFIFEAWLRISRMPPNRQPRNQVPIATQQIDDDRRSGATTLYEVHSCASALPRLWRITPAPCNTGRSD